ncbi:hypothetical protein [Mesonia aquimarina]|uniref:hypothetical protein n=1 Tax=Mesonia aquimarina TaxID=1504967 RepID=UPI0013CF2FDD|nr:hypothetical protein [Mesonia aquimarina]
MRRNIVFLLLCVLIGCSSKDDSEPDRPPVLNKSIDMVAEANQWYINGSLEELDEANGIIKEIRRKLIYYFEGDTLINGLQFKKMYSKQLDSIYHQPISGGVQQFNSTFKAINYVAAMRQNADVVVYIAPNQSTAEVYADFNIQLGDTLNYKWNTYNATVSAIDSIKIGTNYLTQYKLSNDQYFYEGIGASYGLFNTWQTNARLGGFLCCFSMGNDKIAIEKGFYSPANTNLCPEF